MKTFKGRTVTRMVTKGEEAWTADYEITTYFNGGQAGEGELMSRDSRKRGRPGIFLCLGFRVVEEEQEEDRRFREEYRKLLSKLEALALVVKKEYNDPKLVEIVWIAA